MVPQTVLVEAEVSPERLEVTRIVEATRVSRVEVTRQVQVEVTREVRVEVTPTPTPEPTLSNWDAMWNPPTAEPTLTPTPAPPPTLEDRNALIALYHATDGPNWRNNDNWLTDTPLDDWFGVSVGRRGLWLNLQDNGLSGPIPPEIGDLTTVRSIDLSQNDLSGEIPSEFNDLSTLWVLDLAVNQLSGPIPKLDNLLELELLALNNNSLTSGISTILEDINLSSESNLRSDSDGDPRRGLCRDYPALCGSLARLSKLHLDNNPFQEACIEPFGTFYGNRYGLDATDFMVPPVCGTSSYGVPELPQWGRPPITRRNHILGESGHVCDPKNGRLRN